MGGGVGRQVGAGVERQEPEETGLFGAQVRVGEPEDRADGDVLPGQPLQPAPAVGEGAGHRGQRPVGQVGEEGGNNPQGQGEVPAEPGQLGGGGGLVGDAGVAGAPGLAQGLAQQVHGGRGVQFGQVAQAGAESGEGVPGGDEDRDARIGGEQRLRLLGGMGVVHDDEDAAPLVGVGGQHRAVQPRAVLQIGGDVFVGYAEGAQQRAEGAFGGEAALVVVAEEVDEQRAAGEPSLLVQRVPGGLQDELGLAHAGQSGHGADAGCALAGGAGAQRLDEGLQVGVAAGEGGGGGGHAGKGGCDLPRQFEGDVPALCNDVEEDATVDVVVDLHARAPAFRFRKVCRPHARGPARAASRKTPPGRHPREGVPPRCP